MKVVRWHYIGRLYRNLHNLKRTKSRAAQGGAQGGAASCRASDQTYTRHTNTGAWCGDPVLSYFQVEQIHTGKIGSLAKSLAVACRRQRSDRRLALFTRGIRDRPEWGWHGGRPAPSRQARYFRQCKATISMDSADPDNEKWVE